MSLNMDKPDRDVPNSELLHFYACLLFSVLFPISKAETMHPFPERSWVILKSDGPSPDGGGQLAGGGESRARESLDRPWCQSGRT